MNNDTKGPVEKPESLYLFVSNAAHASLEQGGYSNQTFITELNAFLHEKAYLPMVPQGKRAFRTFRTSRGMLLKIVIEPSLRAAAVTLPDESAPDKEHLLRLVFRQNLGAIKGF